jgi:hypothetical protein
MTPTDDALASLRLAMQKIDLAIQALTDHDDAPRARRLIARALDAEHDALSVLPEEPQEAHRGR